MIAVECEQLAREGIMVPDEDISGEHACPCTKIMIHCADILDQQITYQMTSGYHQIPHHTEHDKPILDMINIYW